MTITKAKAKKAAIFAGGVLAVLAVWNWGKEKLPSDAVKLVEGK